MYITLGPPVLSLAVTLLLLSADIFTPTSGTSAVCNELDIQKPPRFGKRDPMTRCADQKRRLQADYTSGYFPVALTRAGGRDLTLSQDLEAMIQRRPEFNNMLAKLFALPTKPMRHLRQSSGYSSEERER